MNNPQLLRIRLSKLPLRQTRLSLPPFPRHLYACYSTSSTRAQREQQEGCGWADGRVKMLYSHQQWREVTAEEDTAYSVGFLGYVGRTHKSSTVSLRAAAAGQGSCNQLTAG